MLENLFVYGTLKKQHGNHGILQSIEAEYLGKLSTQSKFTMFDLGPYPGVVYEGNTSIKGEGYRVSDLALIDTLEGYPDFFNRIKVPIFRDDMEARTKIFKDNTKFWIYIIKPPIPSNLIVPSGEWVY